MLPLIDDGRGSSSLNKDIDYCPKCSLCGTHLSMIIVFQRAQQAECTLVKSK